MTTTITRRSSVHLTREEAVREEFRRYLDAVDARHLHLAEIRAAVLHRLRTDRGVHVEDVDAEEMFRHATGAS